MSEIAKGNANLPHLAMRGNYRDVAAQEIGNVYSRNSAQRQIYVSSLAQKAFKENKTAESLTTTPPEISGENQIGENPWTPKSHGGNRPIGISPF